MVTWVSQHCPSCGALVVPASREEGFALLRLEPSESGTYTLYRGAPWDILLPYGVPLEEPEILALLAQDEHLVLFAEHACRRAA